MKRNLDKERMTGLRPVWIFFLLVVLGMLITIAAVYGLFG